MLDKILYIEDDRDTREEISLFLQHKTKELIVASDGKEGLELFKKHCPSVVISDINMPNMNGLEMSKSIMEIDPFAHIVLLTAHNDANNLHQAITIGIKEYLIKPIKFDELSQKIDFFNKSIQEAQEKKEKYRLLNEYKYAVDNSTIFIKLNLYGYITYANKAFCEVMHYPKEEVEGRALSDFGILDFDLSRVLSGVKKDRFWSGKLEFITQEQLVIFVEGNFFAMCDTDGQIHGIMAILHDITELESLRNICETKLDQSEDILQEKRHYISEYEKVLEQGLAMCRVDSEGKFLKTSKAFHALFEVDKSSLEQKLVYNFFGISQKNFTYFVDSVKKHNTHKGSLEVVIDNKLMFVNITCIGISNIFGALDEIIIIFEDASTLLKQHEKMYEMQIDFLYMLLELIEQHSEDTSFHTKRVSEYSALLAREIGMKKDEVEHIRLAAIMHDIGKIGIPHEILLKNSALNSKERLIMQRHPKIGYDILSQAKQELLKTASIIAYEHHERWDGNGYPRHLKGKDIHIYGRIVAIADVFDALSKQRIYKKAWAINDVYKYLEVNKGVQFDPELIDVFISLKPMIENIRKNY